jgi:CheY-like chemotaxis protein
MNTFFTTTEYNRWMLVDDDGEILAMLSAAIKTMTGAEVECYDSPQCALSAFAATPGKYRLVITDYEMPEMNGAELCRRMRAISPSQEILLATGSGRFTEEEAYQNGFTALLKKPFPLEALRETIGHAGIELALPERASEFYT